MKPLLQYSTLKLTAFWQNASVSHDVIFYFCPATVSSKSVNRGKYTRLAIKLYLCKLTAGYKTSLNVEISCAITIQRFVNLVHAAL